MKDGMQFILHMPENHRHFKTQYFHKHRATILSTSINKACRHDGLLTCHYILINQLL